MASRFFQLSDYLFFEILQIPNGMYASRFISYEGGKESIVYMPPMTLQGASLLASIYNFIFLNTIYHINDLRRYMNVRHTRIY
jgi:hypothetical protein